MLFQHLRLSFRQIRLHPGLAASVILTLALAIGANTAVFSFVNALLLHPFPFRDSDQLVEIHSMRGGQPGRISMRELLDIKEQVPELDGIAGRTIIAAAVLPSWRVSRIDPAITLRQE